MRSIDKHYKYSRLICFCYYGYSNRNDKTHCYVSFFVQRLLIAKEFGDRAAERRAYCNLGNAYIFLGEFEVAAEHYK